MISPRNFNELTSDEQQEVEWAVHKALVDVLEKFNVAGSGPGYSLYREIQEAFDRAAAKKD